MSTKQNFLDRKFYQKVEILPFVETFYQTKCFEKNSTKKFKYPFFDIVSTK